MNLGLRLAITGGHRSFGKVTRCSLRSATISIWDSAAIAFNVVSFVVGHAHPPSTVSAAKTATTYLYFSFKLCPIESLRPICPPMREASTYYMLRGSKCRLPAQSRPSAALSAFLYLSAAPTTRQSRSRTVAALVRPSAVGRCRKSAGFATAPAQAAPPKQKGGPFGPPSF